MATTFEYIFSLKDKAKAAFNNINGAADKVKESFSGAVDNAAKMQHAAAGAFSKISAAAKKAVTGPQFLKSSIAELEDKLADVNRVRFGTVLKSEFDDANREAKALEKQIDRLRSGISGSGIGSKIAGWRKDFADSLPGANLIKNPLTLAGAAVTGFWSATQKAMDAGKEKIKLQTISGSKEIGESLYKGLTDFATDTVFGSEVYDMGVQMLANGIKDTDIMPLMNMLGDISMGDSEKLGQLSSAFAKVNGTGKLTGITLQSMITAGFNPLQVISEKNGESMESLQDKMSKGAISVAQVRSAMEQATGPGGKFNNMLQDVANTPYGQLEGLRGQFEQMVITLGETFLPIASKIMSFFSWLGEKLGPLLKPVGGVLAALSVGLLAAAAAQWVLNLAVWSFPGTWIIMSIAAIAAGAAIAIKHFDSWGATILMLTGPIGKIIGLFVQFYRRWDDIKNAFKVGGILEGLKSIGRTFLHWILDPVRQVLSLIAKIPGAVGRTAQSAIESIDRLNGAMDKADSRNRYLAALQETKDKIAAAKAEEKRAKYLDGLYKASGGKLGKKMESAGLVPTASGVSPEGTTGGLGKQTNEAIVTGGTKNTVVNITIGKMLETIQVNTTNLNEGAKEIRDIIITEITRAVAMGGALA